LVIENNTGIHTHWGVEGHKAKKERTEIFGARALG